MKKATKKNSKKALKKKLRGIVVLLCLELIAVILMTGIDSFESAINGWCSDIQLMRVAHAAEVTEDETKKVEAEVITEAEAAVEAETHAHTFSPSISVDHNSLLEMNSNYLGWIHCPGINVSEPVVAGVDNEWYLHHSFDNNENWKGSLFTDERTATGFDCPYTIVYGHNLSKYGEKFGNLTNYQDAEFRDANPYIEVVYADGTAHQFEVFCFMQTRIDCMEVYDICNVDNVTRYEFAKANSYYDVDVDVDAKNLQLLTLSTCVGSDQPERWIVMAAAVQ